jgi:hypothetical protein
MSMMRTMKGDAVGALDVGTTIFVASYSNCNSATSANNNPSIAIFVYPFMRAIGIA